MKHACSSIGQLKVVNFNQLPKPSPHDKLLIKLGLKSAIDYRKLGQLDTDSKLLLQHNNRCLDFALVNSDKINIGILCRNPADFRASTKALLLSARKKGLPIWSFDHYDCEQYGFRYYPQFISTITNTRIEPHNDFSFLGKKKGREERYAN